MIQRVPSYYKEFACTAAACRDNCCIGGWQIDIDEETARSYLEWPGAFGDRLRAAVCSKTEYGFRLVNGRCPFLDSHNLCEIHQNLGPEHMGVVCTQFPRFSEYFGAVKETGIGLACEEAARIILSDRNAFTPVSAEIPETAEPDSEYDARLGDSLFILREKFFTMISLNRYDLFEKLSALVLIGSRLQQQINANDPDAVDKTCRCFDPKEYLEAYRRQSAARPEGSFAASLPALESQTRKVLDAFLGLEVLNDGWRQAMAQVLATLHPEAGRPEKAAGGRSYLSVFTGFYAYMKDRMYEYENLISYYLFRYLLKASYDHDLFGKTQFICACFIVLLEMDMTRWQTTHRQFTVEDHLDTVHILSREIEYSEDNLWNLAEEFIFDDIFKAQSLSELLNRFHILSVQNELDE